MGFFFYKYIFKQTIFTVTIRFCLINDCIVLENSLVVDLCISITKQNSKNTNCFQTGYLNTSPISHWLEKKKVSSHWLSCCIIHKQTEQCLILNLKMVHLWLIGESILTLKKKIKHCSFKGWTDRLIGHS